METKDLFDIWKNEEKNLINKNKISREMIENYFTPKVRKTSLVFIINMLMYLLIGAAGAVLTFINIFGYLNNKNMILVLVVMLIFAIGLLVYGIILLRMYRAINRFSNDLMTQLEKQLNFYKTHYEIWMVVVSLLVLLLPYSWNFLLDNQNGYYPIYNVTRFVLFSTFMFLFIYGVLKFGNFIQVSYIKAYLTDLKNDMLENTEQFEKRKRKYKWIGILLLIILSCTLILGALKMSGLI
jgi:hypothetical protein